MEECEENLISFVEGLVNLALRLELGRYQRDSFISHQIEHTSSLLADIPPLFLSNTATWRLDGAYSTLEIFLHLNGDVLANSEQRLTQNDIDELFQLSFNSYCLDRSRL